MNRPSVITIDGPAASGKSTIGHMLAGALNYLFFDTGSMYRAVTLAVLERAVPVTDETAVTALTQALQIEILPAHGHDDGRLHTVLLDAVDVTWALRSPLVDANVSLVSSYAGVREELVRRQREVAAVGRVVMVGRDIGTVVLPDAPLKLYVVASDEERARRRWEERRLHNNAGSYDAILADMRRRDSFDGSRQHSPMRPAIDAIMVDTTGDDPEAVVATILALDCMQAPA